MLPWNFRTGTHRHQESLASKMHRLVFRSVLPPFQTPWESNLNCDGTKNFGTRTHPHQESLASKMYRLAFRSVQPAFQIPWKNNLNFNGPWNFRTRTHRHQESPAIKMHRLIFRSVKPPFQTPWKRNLNSTAEEIVLRPQEFLQQENDVEIDSGHQAPTQKCHRGSQEDGHTPAEGVWQSYPQGVG